MKLVDSSIKNALKQPTTQRKGRILINNQYYDIYNVEYYSNIYDEGKVIGNAIATQLDFDIPYMQKFDKFRYYDGVWTGSNYEYVDMGDFIVFDENDEDEFTKHITAFDELINFNKPFQEIGTYPRTLYEELENVCEQAEVVLLNDSIPNGDFIVDSNQFVNEESLKTVLKSICAISGTFGIKKVNGLKLQLKEETNETMNKSQHEPMTWKRRSYGINQVVIGDATIEGEYAIRQDIEDIELNGVHQLVIQDNLFAYNQVKREQLIDELFNQVKGFGYIPYELKGEWLNYLEVGDVVTIDDVETVVLRILGKSATALDSEMSAPAIIDSSIEYVDNTNDIENRMKRTEIVVNKAIDEINIIAENIVPISSEAYGIGNITLENAYEGLLHKLTIKGQISLYFPQTEDGLCGYPLVPRDGLVPSNELTPSSPVPYGNEVLYPSQDLYPKGSVLLIDDERYVLDFDFLNYMNNNVCDEFVYEEGKTWIIRRVGIDDEGNMYELQNEVVEHRNDIILNVKSDSVIQLESFSNAIFYSEYLTQNEYTDTFAPAYDLVSRINLTPGNAQIQSDKITLEGKTIDLTSDNIAINSNNFKVDTEGNMTCSTATLTNGIMKIGEKEIFNTSGVLSTMIVNGVINTPRLIFSGDFCPLGEFWDGSNTYTKEHVAFSFIIPDNFTVLSAYVILQHEPLISKSSSTVTGRCRNLALYEGYLVSSSKKYVDWLNGYIGNANTSYIQISNAWQGIGTTFTGSTSSMTSATSIDLKDYISKGANHFAIMSTNGSTSINESNYGAVLAQLYGTGYTKLS